MSRRSGNERYGGGTEEQAGNRLHCCFLPLIDLFVLFSFVKCGCQSAMNCESAVSRRFRVDSGRMATGLCAAAQRGPAKSPRREPRACKNDQED
jgi:hypothetical protein